MEKKNLYPHSPLKPDSIYTKYYKNSSENKKKISLMKYYIYVVVLIILNKQALDPQSNY